MEATHDTLRLRWGAVTDIGCARAANQDAVLASPPLFIVADGMGGHAAGDVASRLAIDTFTTLLDRPAVSLRDLVVAARWANERILADVDATPERSGMGTTVTGFAVGVGPLGAVAAVLNVGDSRTYLLREGDLRPLTVDHSVVQELIDAGEIGLGDASTHPYRHVVTRVLGGDADLEVDTSAVPVRRGDRLLVCSDGLTSVVDHRAIEAALSGPDAAEQATDRLLALALESGAPDNVSVIVVEIVDAPEQTLDDAADGDTLPGARAPLDG